MSFLAKTTTGFFGLGICSITSLIIAHQYKEVTLKLLAAPPAVKISTPTVAESIKRLKDAGYKGCANLTTSGDKGTSFYVCVMGESNGANNPHFYYHDKTGTHSFPQLKRVKKSTSSSSQWEFELFFAKSGNKTVKMYYFPFWFRNLKDPDGDLEKSCQLIKGSDNSESLFTLKCNDREVQRKIQI